MGDDSGWGTAGALPARFFERAMVAVDQAVMATDIENRVRFWNDAAEKLYGYSRSEAVGRLVWELIVPADGAAAADERVAALRAGRTYVGDWPLRDKAGRRILAHVVSTPIIDDDGRWLGVLGISSDVSARRATEAAAGRLADIVQSSADAILETDLDGIVRSANPAVAELFGYAPEAVVGRPIDILIAPEAASRTAEGIAALSAGRPLAELISKGLRRDGSVIDIAVRVSPVRDSSGGVVGISGIIRDVTEVVRTRGALEASERRYRALFEQAQIAQVEVDLSGTVLAVNDAFSRLVGREAGALVGTDIQDILHPDDDGAGNVLVAAMMAGLRETATWERTLIGVGGAPLPVLVHATLLRAAGGTPYGIATFIQDLRDLREAETALVRREALFEALVRGSSDCALVLETDGTVRYVSSTVTAQFGYQPGDVAGHDITEFTEPGDPLVGRAVQAVQAVAADPGTTQTVLFHARNAAGDWRWVELALTNCLADPAIGGIVGNARDVTARVTAEQALRDSEARFRAIAETAQEGIWATDDDGRTWYANRKLADILGVPVETVYDRPASELLDPDDPGRLADHLRLRREFGDAQFDLSYAHPDGGARVLRISVGPLRDDLGRTGTLSMVADVTDARRAEQELARRALRDDLTGLANRTLFMDRLQHSLARAERRDGGTVAVLFVDLDQFRLVNDSWGRDAGDRLLVQVAGRIAAPVRQGDTVARMGGDEFALICDDADARQAQDIAGRLLATLGTPFLVDGQRAHVRASVGIAVSPADSAAELLRFAESAMYDAKARGRGRVQIFDATVAAEAAEATDRLSLSNDLRDALEDNVLALHYQPVVDLATGHVVGVEGLARWNHPTRGHVSPAIFVDIAESTGLAPALGRWAVDRARRDAPLLRAAIGPGLRIAVNISARHLADSSLEDTVLAALKTGELRPSELVLEITESAIMENPDQARGMLQRLRGHGVETAIDDFGTGYSSLGYLHRLPVTTLKIDRSFVNGVTTDPDALAITSSIVELARAMSLRTVAEGVETTEQLTVLLRLGCTAGQGFLWSPARPPHLLAELVSALPDGRFDVTLAEAQIDSSRRGGVHRPGA